MSELTIEHICGYLPYGLDGRYNIQDVSDHYPSEIRQKILRSDNVAFFIDHCKPLLYPLSHLTKEIDHKGKRFVPTEFIKPSPIFKVVDVFDDGKCIAFANGIESQIVQITNSRGLILTA